MSDRRQLSAIGRTIAHGLLAAVGSLVLAGCFETEYGPLLAGRPVYEMLHLEESYDYVCALPSTATIDTSLDAHPGHRRNLLDYSVDDEGREVVRNHAHEAYGLSDFHAERRPDYDDERGEAWLTFIHGEHVQVPPEGEDFWIAYRHGPDCLADNNIMLFPYVVDPEPPIMQIVAVPIVVDGVEPKLDGEFFLDPFYKSIMEVFPVTGISMRNREADDPDLRIIVPGDSPAFDPEEGTLDLRAIVSAAEWAKGSSDISLTILRWERHWPRDIFMGFYDEYDPEWVRRFGAYDGLAPLGHQILGGGGKVIFPANYYGESVDPPFVVPFIASHTHEIGHALDLQHAPCKVPGYTEPDFPHPDGGLGGATMWGETRNAPSDYDPRGPLMSDETGYVDIMGYCAPEAISPFHFKKALEWQVHGLDEWEKINGNSGAAGSLALSGYINSAGVPVLTSVSVSPEPPITQRGPFAINVLDEAGFLAATSRFRTTANYLGADRIEDTWGARVPLPTSVGSAQITDADGGLLSTARLNAGPGRRFELVQ